MTSPSPTACALATVRGEYDGLHGGDAPELEDDVLIDLYLTARGAATRRSGRKTVVKRREWFPAARLAATGDALDPEPDSEKAGVGEGHLAQGEK